MIPGAVHPLLMSGGGDPLDELGVIARSLRFRPTASAYLSRVNGAVGATNYVFTKRICFKLGAADTGAYGLFSGFINANNYAYIAVSNNAVVVTTYSSAVSYMLTSNAIERDPAGHYDLCVGFDVSQPLLANRVSVELNGVSLTMSGNYPQNEGHAYDYSGATVFIGATTFTGSPQSFFNGVVSHAVSIVGSKLPATSFGQFHPRTRQWRPKGKAAIKALADAAGANSYFLDYSDPTNTTTLCADVSSHGNNWTATNISLTAGATYDSLLDTPTNNFCTFNPLTSYVGGGVVTLSNANLTGDTGTTGGGYIFGSQGIPINAEQRFFEIQPYAGVPTASCRIGVSNIGLTNWVIFQNDGQRNINGVVSAYGASYTDADVIGVKVSIQANTVEFFKNGVSQGVIAGQLSAIDYFPYVADGSGSTAVAVHGNFGQRSFAYAGNQGTAKALNTKNLPFPKVPNAESAFVARTDSGANIVATLAAAASFADLIKIYKRRDAAEGWRWQFSDDPTNCLESNNTNAKIAFPALPGSSYSGQAIKVSAANGVATGRLVHTNGVADVVTDGLTYSRKMVMLRSEAGGNWFVYHPDLTAGKLLYLNLTSAETTDATISSVTASGFAVAAAIASGTYRWISFAEVDGFLKLWKYIANGSTDGPFHNDGLSASATWWKDADTGTNNWHDHDIARDPYNQSNANLIINLSDAESSLHGMDMTSAGVKLRNSTSGSNLSGAKHVGISFAAFPFRYANAR